MEPELADFEIALQRYSPGFSEACPLSSEKWRLASGISVRLHASQ
jgi:hypothetical protein